MNATKTILFLLTASLSMTEVHAQCHVQKVVASDSQAYDRFGGRVAVDGEWAAVSAPDEDDFVVGGGAVYLFQRIGGTWTEVQKLTVSGVPEGSAFGSSIALVGNVLAVGVPGDAPLPPNPNTLGSAYVFELISGTWTQTAKLIASNPGNLDRMGESVAMVTDRILLGAAGGNTTYVFDRIGGTWVQTAKLFGSDAGPFSGFGLSVALDGDEAIVGAPNQNGSLGPQEGAAYVFQKGPSGWVEVQKLVASDPDVSARFGYTVAIRDTRAVVGAYTHDHGAPQTGAVYAFVKSGSVWVQTQELLPTDAAVADSFGNGLALSADHFIVGAGNDDDDTGSAYDFRWNGSSWIQAGKLLGRDAFYADELGKTVAIDGQTVLVGSWESAYFFELAPTATQYGSCPTAAPCNNQDDHGGCRNSTGQGAVMAACGSGSVATDDLRLEVTHCPPNKLTLLFMGPAQVTVPVFDGIRVVGQQQPTAIYRYGGVAADSIGRVVRGPGLVLRSQLFPAPGRIQSGQTWNFQYWYRDNQGPCGSGTNFSNGVSVDFGP